MATKPEPPKPVPPRPGLAFGQGDPRTRVTAINARPVGFTDLYYVLLRMTWTRLLLLVTAAVFLLNLTFGLLFWWSQGVASARPDSFTDHFFFSVQTFGTIGFGNMYPQNFAAEAIMSVEALSTLLLNAVVTGLAFSKFARPSSRTLWSESVVICDRDHEPTLMVRVANERMNNVVEANMRAAIVRSEVTREGEKLRRILDLQLVRSTTPSFILTWSVMHKITPESPLYGLTREQMEQQNLQLVLTLTGLDETLGQTIHARQAYTYESFRYGHRYEDVLGQVDATGRSVVDYGRFHLTAPAPLNWKRIGLEAPDEPLRAAANSDHA